MKKRFYTFGYVLFLGFLALLFTSCLYNPSQIIVRIPFEDLQSGGFYGGNLIYNPSDPQISHLGKGSLIAFQDILYGWEAEEDGSFCPVMLKKDYGYLYVKKIAEDGMVYDFLVYNDIGEIIGKGEDLILSTLFGSPDYSQAPRDGNFSGICFFSDVGNFNDSISGSYLLNFQQEFPVEGEDGEIPVQETYRRIVFRIHGDPESPFEFEKGVIAVSHSHPHSLVVNSSFLSEYAEHGEATETCMGFYKSSNLPEFHEGDFILDAGFGVVRRIVSVDDSNPLFILLQSEQSNMDEAVGTVVVNAEGDLEEIINRYGSPSDRKKLQNSKDAKKKFNLLKKDWELDIVDKENLKVTLTNTFSLDVDIGVNFHLSWKELSSKGYVTFPMEFSSILTIEALLAFQESESRQLADPGISFSVSGIPIRIDMPIDFTYLFEAELAELNFEFGPELYIDLGFTYDIGAKIKFKWKIIPVGIKTWHHASGIHTVGTKFDGPTVTYSERPELQGIIEIKMKPGITIACVVRPQMEIPFQLKSDLTVNLSEEKRSTGKLTLDFYTRGELEIKIGVKFISKTFHLGKVFEELVNIGEWTF